MESILNVLTAISEKVMVKEIAGPILVICISILLNGLVKNIVHRFFHIDKKKLRTKEEKRTVTVVSLITNIIKYVIILIDVLIILGIYGIPTASIIASLGAVGVVLGLALQDTLKDFVSGFFIITDNLYRMGDWIEVGGFEGEVINVGLKTTQIRAYTGEVKIISNRTVTEVINYNLSNTLAIVDVPIPYEEDYETAEKVLSELCVKLTDTLDKIRGTVTLLGINDYNEKGLIYRITVDTVPTEHYGVQREIRKQVKIALDQNHIKMGYPQVVVHNGKRV